MTVIVEVPGHGEVEFPDGMSDAEMEAAIRKNFMLPPKQAPKVEMKQPSRLERGLTAAGRGLMTGGPMGMISAAGAEGMKQQGEVLDAAAYDAGGKVTDMTGSPELGFAANVATQAIPTVLGGAASKVASPVLQSGAKSLMQSALKPTIADLKSGRAAKAVDTLLERGINPTQGGVAQLKTHIDELNGQVEAAIAKSTATVNKADVGSHLRSTWESFKNQVNPQGDLETIRKAWDSFKNHPLLAGKMEIPVQTAQSMKQGTYAQVGKKYGQMGSAEIEAQKGLARGLKEEISKAVPEVGPLNKAESELINALNVAERRALMDANKNPMGLALLANNPASWAAFMADKSALFKSLVARLMNSGSSAIPTTAGAAAGGLYGSTLGQPEGGALYPK